MRVIRLRAQGGLENLELVDEDHPEPRPDELLVRIRACSLNFRDVFVAQGKTPCADGRIPLSDGAGEVIAVGDDVDEFKIGDFVVSTFYPYWLAGEMTPAIRPIDARWCPRSEDRLPALVRHSIVPASVSQAR